MELTFTRLRIRSLSLRPGNLLTPLNGALSMGFKRQRFPHLLPSKLHGFGLLPWRDLHPQVCAALRWARQEERPDPICFIRQVSAIGRYSRKKFSIPLLYRRWMVSSGTSCPPTRTRSATRATAKSALGSHRNTRWKVYPLCFSFAIQGAKDLLARVVSKAKSTRSFAR